MADATDLSDALETIFLEQGFRDATYRSLASRLNCSNRKLYALAPSKEALFLKIIGRFFTTVKREGWERARADEPLAERIRGYLRVGIRAAERTGPNFTRDIAALDSGRALFDAFQAERIEGLRLLIQEGIDSGEFEGFHAQLVAEVMIQSARRLREPDFLAESNLTFAQALIELSRLVRFGLTRRA